MRCLPTVSSPVVSEISGSNAWWAGLVNVIAVAATAAAAAAATATNGRSSNSTAASTNWVAACSE